MARADRPGCPHAPPPHPEEEARLADLQLLGIVDSPPEDRFDQLTQLVSVCLEAPYVLISLLDDQREWIKSHHGLEVEPIPRVRSLCAHAILEGDFFEVEDAGDDPRFERCPLVEGPAQIRHYAAATLRGPHGLPVGTLSILDTTPRRLDAREREIIRGFADAVESELSLEYRRARSDQADLDQRQRCPLTQCLARQPGLDRLHGMLIRATAARTRVALIIADIVDFNAINSAFGRQEGDRILRSAAHLIERAVPVHSMVFRIQGDQFGVAIELGQDGPNAVQGALSALTNTFAEPIEVDGHEVTLQLALGSAIFPDRAVGVGELVDRAFLALRRAQEQRTLAEVFTTELEERLVREVAVEQGLRGALASRRLSVAYQPKIELATGRPISMEALCRWIDPDLGFVSPAEFIPAAERTGMIVELGRQVLATAIEDVLRLRQHLPHMTVSVNVAAAQLQASDFVESVLELLVATGAPPEALELEVVETSVIENVEVAVSVIERLRAAGVGFSLDDFGTGYSSLAYLHRLPVQIIKIDRGFVNNMTSSARDAALVRSIISMAHVLEFDVVAEGVETDVQAQMLTEFGCDIGQGYLWFRPMPFDQVLEKVREHSEAQQRLASST